MKPELTVADLSKLREAAHTGAISLDLLANITGWKPSEIQIMGIYAVINQTLATYGLDGAVHCEDSRMAGQDQVDALRDLNRYFG